MILLLVAAVFVRGGPPVPLPALVHLPPSGWAKVEHGGIVAVTQGGGKEGVGFAAAARLHTSRQCFLTDFEDIARFDRGRSVLQIGKFSDPPVPADLAGLTLEDRDIEDLQNCRVGHCGVKLSADLIRQLPRAGGVHSAAYSARLNTLFRGDLLHYVQTYLKGGNRNLMVYSDKSVPVSLAAQFRTILASWQSLDTSAPPLRQYLDHPGQHPLPPHKQFLYWSKENFGFRPVISITQVVIWERPGQTWIASKQIYASHYFNGSLGLTVLADASGDPGGSGAYLLYLNRSNIDVVARSAGGLYRSVLQTRLKRRVRRRMARIVRGTGSRCRSQGRVAAAD